jgi:exo-1,4-beta-D-glucosaminidase
LSDVGQYNKPHDQTGSGGAAAQLTVKAELKNAAGQAVDGVLKGKIEGLEFSQHVRLGPGETRTVRFTPEKFPQLKLTHPRLWWPAQAGPKNLYPLDVQFEANGRISDSTHIDFGFREVTSEIDGQGHRLFHINGKNILIRGAGYTFDMLLRETPEQQKAELRYVRDMNLNAVRFEGKLEDDHFLELCGRYGILVMAGWCCCDHWEQWHQWDQEDETIAFAVHLKVKKSPNGDQVLPVLWEDNYFRLLPGESRRVTATYGAGDLGGAAPVVEVDGWNLKATLAP